MKTLPERIRTAREEAGLSQADVARALRISASAVNQWEQGFSKNIKLEHFFALPVCCGKTRAGSLPARRTRERERQDTAGNGQSHPHRPRTSTAALCSPNAGYPAKNGVQVPERSTQPVHLGRRIPPPSLIPASAPRRPRTAEPRPIHSVC